MCLCYRSSSANWATWDDARCDLELEFLRNTGTVEAPAFAVEVAEEAAAARLVDVAPTGQIQARGSNASTRGRLRQRANTTSPFAGIKSCETFFLFDLDNDGDLDLGIAKNLPRLVRWL
jgi:hypothetical protein